MSWYWNSSSHPIADVRDWSLTKRLELRPDFQRAEVWSEAAKIMLMDTILRNIPMPKIYLEARIKDASTFRIVIDGQQRLKAILGFIGCEYSLKEPYAGEFLGKTYSELPEDVKQRFLGYKIDINEIVNATDLLIREIYSRVNKYTVALNKQELRRADYPGDFLILSEQLALLDFFDDARMFSATARRRMGDIEFCSELLAALIDGPQDKTETLDDFYVKYSKWQKEDRENCEKAFKAILNDITEIFKFVDQPFSRTRFRQKADFYCLFSAIHEIHTMGYSLNQKELYSLGQDLNCLDYNISPDSRVEIMREYAIKCVSQANTINSRKWRMGFLKNILLGTYAGRVPGGEISQMFKEIELDLHDDLFGQSPSPFCFICNDAFPKGELHQIAICWPKDTTAFQISNAKLLHRTCLQKNTDAYICGE